jgi:hypothetical protein
MVDDKEPSAKTPKPSGRTTCPYPDANTLFCKLKAEEQLALVDMTVEKAVKRSLEEIGLQGEDALNDIKELRELIRAYRVTRRDIWKGLWQIPVTLFANLWKIMLTVTTLWLMVKLTGTEATRETVRELLPR